MTFLAPLMLVGLIGVAIPLVIHLIGRRRARVVKFAALAFLIGSKRKTSRRLQLRERLLLVVRLLACVALPLAIAKPFTSCRARGPTVARGPQAVVFVIDDSFTSGYRIGGRSLLDREIDAATRILQQLGPEAEVAVVRASEGSPNPTELSREQLRLRDSLLDLTPTARPADLRRALARAAQLLAGSSHKTKTVYLVAPLTVNSLPPGDPAWAADGPALEIYDVRKGEALPNLAVTSLTVSPDPTSGARGIAIVAEIANHGTTPVADVTLSVEVDGSVVARGRIDLAPGEVRGKRFLATLPPERRSAPVAVAIPDDALATDNRRWAIARLRDDVRVLLVDGDARADRHDDEVFYLEAALRPGDRGEAGTVVTKVLPDELDDLDLSGFDVVVLANVPALTQDVVTTLAAWVATGGGLLVAPGDHVDPAAYDATMLPLLPQSLRDPIDTAWGAAPDERAARALHLTKWEADHPIFAPFAKDAPGLADAAFTKVMLLGPTTATADRKVLARFTNGAAAMVLAHDRRRPGAALHVDARPRLERPADPPGLPAAGAGGGALPGPPPRRQPDAGDPGRRQPGLPTLELKKLEVRGPGSSSTTFDDARLAGRTSVRLAAPSARRLPRDRHRQDRRDPRARRARLRRQPRPARLRPRAGAALAAADQRHRRADQGAGKPPRRRVELWHAVAAALLTLLLLESILIQQRR
jgi:hypothetical protein